MTAIAMGRSYWLKGFHREGRDRVARIGASASRGAATLLELMIVLAVIVLISTTLVLTFSGDSSKASKLMADMMTLRDALSRAKADLGGVPKKVDVLWSRDASTAANMYSGVTAVNAWNGPYIDRMEADASGKLTMPSITDGATVAILQEAKSADNGANHAFVYYVSSSGVPDSIVSEAFKKCTGSDLSSITEPGKHFLKSPCRVSGTAGSLRFEVRVSDSN
jgi:type II secretory pathway pseudopilin PulG